MFDWILGFVRANGYLGIAFMMLAENVFPPIPSELIMPLAGFLAAQGKLSLVIAIVAGSIGSLLGACFWYWVGAKLGLDRVKAFAGRHGRWLTLSRGDIEKADRWFDRHGKWAVLLGRLVPTVRTLISIPAGVSDMRLRTFLVFTSVGTAIWTALLAVGGYWLENSYDRIAGWVGPVSNVIVVGIVVFYLYRVVTFRPHR